MVAKCKTICVKCKYHNNPPDERGIVNWWGHICRHPSLKRLPEQSPITGEIKYGTKNSLGMIVLTDDAYPHCSEINKGNCELFEEAPRSKFQKFVDFFKEHFTTPVIPS